MSVNEIAEAIQTRADGTNFNDIKLINDKIVNAVPSVEFVPEFSSHTLE